MAGSTFPGFNFFIIEEKHSLLTEVNSDTAKYWNMCGFFYRFGKTQELKFFTPTVLGTVRWWHWEVTTNTITTFTGTHF